MWLQDAFKIYISLSKVIVLSSAITSNIHAFEVRGLYSGMNQKDSLMVLNNLYERGNYINSTSGYWFSSKNARSIAEFCAGKLFYVDFTQEGTQSDAQYLLSTLNRLYGEAVIHYIPEGESYLWKNGTNEYTLSLYLLNYYSMQEITLMLEDKAVCDLNRHHDSITSPTNQNAHFTMLP